MIFLVQLGLLVHHFCCPRDVDNHLQTHNLRESIFPSQSIFLIIQTVFCTLGSYRKNDSVHYSAFGIKTLLFEIISMIVIAVPPLFNFGVFIYSILVPRKIKSWTDKFSYWFLSSSYHHNYIVFDVQKQSWLFNFCFHFYTVFSFTV